MRVVCHYCGFSCDSMIDGMRHDALRPSSCERWLELTKPLSLTPAQIEGALRRLTIESGRNLDVELDAYGEKIEPVYR